MTAPFLSHCGGSGFSVSPSPRGQTSLVLVFLPAVCSLRPQFSERRVPTSRKLLVSLLGPDFIVSPSWLIYQVQ